MKYLVFDITNMLYRTFFVNTGVDDKTLTGLATHMALTTLHKYFRQHKPHKVVMAFDRTPSWRHEYLSSGTSVSKLPYKGNRRQNMTDAQAEKYAKFKGHIKEFLQLIHDHTTITTLISERLEADDLIAGFVRQSNPEQDEVILISSDSDFIQLLRYPNLTIVSPDTDKLRTLQEYNNNPDYYLFVKCMRGDKSDNIMSAYPRVQEKKLAKAFFEDPYLMTTILETKWKHGDGTEYLVKDVFNENQLLINLDKQPDDIKGLVSNVISTEFTRAKQFSFFHFLRFLGKYDLKKVADNFEQYKDLLAR